MNNNFVSKAYYISTDKSKFSIDVIENGLYKKFGFSPPGKSKTLLKFFKHDIYETSKVL